MAAGQISAGGRAYKMGRLMERRLYAKADAMSCVASPMAEYLRQASGKAVAVVYNGVSAAGKASEVYGSAHDVAPPRKEILYTGNWGRLQGLDVLLSAWAKVCHTEFFREWTVRLIGAGVMAEELKERAEAHAVSRRVRFEPPVEKAEALWIMEGAGLLFLSLRADPVFDYTIPSKLFDYLRAGRPIVGGIPGEGAEILRESGGNVTFSPGSTEELVTALTRVEERYALLLEKARRNRSIVAGRFTREAATKQLVALFESAPRP